MCAACELNQPTQWKPGIEIGLYQQSLPAGIIVDTKIETKLKKAVGFPRFTTEVKICFRMNHTLSLTQI